MQKFFYFIFKKIKQLDNYSLAILLGLPLATALLIAFLALGGWSAVWYFNLLLPTLFVASFLSGASYIGRIVDGVTLRTQVAKPNLTLRTVVRTVLNSTVFADRQMSIGEKLGTVLGAVLGLAIMAAFIGVGGPIPMFGVFSYFAHCLFGLSLAGLFAGLGARLGSLAGQRVQVEKITLGIAAGLGLLLAIGFVSLILLFPTLSVPGIWVTSLLVGSTHLPVWLSMGIFTIGFTSMVTACADYFCKAGCFLYYLMTQQQNANVEINQMVAKKMHEYRGAFVGVLLGLALSVLAILPLIIVPPISMAIGGIIALGVIAFVAITSGAGGIASRIGRVIDNVSKKTEEKIAKINEDKQLTIKNSLSKDSTKKILQCLQVQSDLTICAANEAWQATVPPAIYPAVLKPCYNLKLSAKEKEFENKTQRPKMAI